MRSSNFLSIFLITISSVVAQNREPGCPPINPETKGNCKNLCGPKDKCPEGELCCFNGCGRSCMKREKPGDCPHLGYLGSNNEDTCNLECISDYGCKGNLKCCPKGCGHVCIEPVRNNKKGVCPKPSEDDYGSCKVTCRSDEDCDGDNKCCSNGCGYRCMLPF